MSSQHGLLQDTNAAKHYVEIRSAVRIGAFRSIESAML
jgi:hypothetical protein